jgi:hypothetical protein
VTNTPHRSRRRAAPLLALLVACALATGACGDGDGDKESEEGRSVADADTPTTVCDTSATAPVPTELAEALRPPSTDTIRTADASGGKDVLVVPSQEKVDDVLQRYKAAVPSQGFAIDSEDDEGREAELYFSKGGRKGSLLIKMSSCPPGSTSYQLTVPTA